MPKRANHGASVRDGYPCPDDGKPRDERVGTMARILYEGTMCECCRMVVANGDDSGCRDYYEHKHTPPTVPDYIARICDETTDTYPIPDGASWDAWLVCSSWPDADPDTEYDDEGADGFCELCDSHDGYQTVYPFAIIR